MLCWAEKIPHSHSHSHSHSLSISPSCPLIISSLIITVFLLLFNPFLTSLSLSISISYPILPSFLSSLLPLSPSSVSSPSLSPVSLPHLPLTLSSFSLSLSLSPPSLSLFSLPHLLSLFRSLLYLPTRGLQLEESQE